MFNARCEQVCHFCCYYYFATLSGCALHSLHGCTRACSMTSLRQPTCCHSTCSSDLSCPAPIFVLLQDIMAMQILSKCPIPVDCVLDCRLDIACLVVFLIACMQHRQTVAGRFHGVSLRKRLCVWRLGVVSVRLCAVGTDIKIKMCSTSCVPTCAHHLSLVVDTCAAAAVQGL